MARLLRREFYLLPRGEQRGLIFLSLLLICSLVLRFTLELLPDREPEGLEEFRQEALLLLADLARADTLRQVRADSLAQSGRKYPVSKANSANRHTGSYKPIPIDINRADSAELLPLPGIGPVFAGRIIRYRDLLGGFVHANQLSEVYGMPAETIERIVDRIEIDTGTLIKLDLNTAGFRELLRHPYLEYEDVLSLVNYRDFAGAIQSIDKLKENHILPDSVLGRVAPYIYFSKAEAVEFSKKTR